MSRPFRARTFRRSVWARRWAACSTMRTTPAKAIIRFWSSATASGSARSAAIPSILNHKMKLGNVVYDIVGVAPAEFFGTKVGEAPDAWAPLSMAGADPSRLGQLQGRTSPNRSIFWAG